MASAREAKETARALAAAAAISRQKGDKAAREDVQGDGKAKHEQKKQKKKKKKLTPMEKLKLRMQQKFNNTVSKSTRVAARWCVTCWRLTVLGWYDGCS